MNDPYPLVRDLPRDTKYSNAAWVIIALVAAGVVFAVFRDFNAQRPVMLQPVPGMTVRIDGTELDRPYYVELEVGSHRVDVEGPGKQARRTFTIEITDDSRSHVYIIDRDGIRRL